MIKEWISDLIACEKIEQAEHQGKIILTGKHNSTLFRVIYPAKSSLVEGDIIMVEDFASAEYDGKEYYLVDESDVLCIIKEDEE